MMSLEVVVQMTGHPVKHSLCSNCCSMQYVPPFRLSPLSERTLRLNK